VRAENDNYTGNFVSIGLIVCLSLFTLLNQSFNGNKQSFMAIVFIAICLSLISISYIWSRPRHASLVRHVKSWSQSIAVTLLICAILIYFYHIEGSGLV
jgi:Kef-type K+ transport system membrane component KefB